MNYPKYRTSKSIQVKLAPQVAVMGCEYKHLVRAFGNPNLAADYGDEFDGVEKCAWHIQFETGQVAIISDVRPFGIHDMDYRIVKEWRVNAHDTLVYDWIKEIVRDMNPNA